MDHHIYFFLPFGGRGKMVASLLLALLLKVRQQCASSYSLFLFLLLAVPRALTWFVYTLVLVLYEFNSIIFQKSVEHLVTCLNIWHVFAPVQSLYMEKGTTKRLIRPPCEWRDYMPYVKDEFRVSCEYGQVLALSHF